MFRREYGLADIARGVAIRPQTTLDVDSISKQFTALAILQLAERGEVSLVALHLLEVEHGAEEADDPAEVFLHGRFALVARATADLQR